MAKAAGWTYKQGQAGWGNHDSMIAAMQTALALMALLSIADGGGRSVSLPPCVRWCPHHRGRLQGSAHPRQRGLGQGDSGPESRGNSTLALQGVDVFSFGNSCIATGGIGVTINNSELSLNGGDSASAGGGISFSGTNQSLTVTNSTIDNNQCAFGGGIRYGGDGTFTMKSSTVSTNHSGSEGGGLDLSGGAGTMSIIGSTIAYNDTNGTGGGVAVEVVDLASFSLNGSIIANNVGADFFAPDLWTADSNRPSVTNSLLSNAGGADFVNDASKSNLLGVDPQFVDAGSGLNGAGGPFNIPVHRIGPGSPGLDHILSLSLASRAPR